MQSKLKFGLEYENAGKLNSLVSEDALLDSERLFQYVWSDKTHSRKEFAVQDFPNGTARK